MNLVQSPAPSYAVSEKNEGNVCTHNESEIERLINRQIFKHSLFGLQAKESDNSKYESDGPEI